MRLTLIFLVVLACVALTLGCDKSCQAKKEKRKQEAALKKACKELGGGTKIKLEIDLGGACRGKCKNRQKKAKKGGPKPAPRGIAGPPKPAPPAPPKPAGVAIGAR